MAAADSNSGPVRLNKKRASEIKVVFVITSKSASDLSNLSIIIGKLDSLQHISKCEHVQEHEHPDNTLNHGRQHMSTSTRAHIKRRISITVSAGVRIIMNINASIHPSASLAADHVHQVPIQI
jgi:hypothetical protein